MGFCNYYSGYVRMYAELSGPLHKMLQVGKFDGRKRSKKKLAWTPEAEDAFNRLRELGMQVRIRMNSLEFEFAPNSHEFVDHSELEFATSNSNPP